MKYSLIFLILSSFALSKVSAQDLHFTHNHFAPLYFNPAQTGAFLGTYRASAVYRDQNRSFFGTSYQTPIISVDSPFMFGFKKNHWIGAGVTLYSDKAGDHSYRSSGFLGSIAYHLGLDKKMNNVFTLGVRYGFVSRTIADGIEGTFGDEIADNRGTLQSSPDRDLLNDFSGGYNSLSVGLLFKSKMSKTSSFEIGGSGIHVLAGDYRFSQGSFDNKSSLRINGHARLNTQISKQLVLSPTVYYSKESTSQNIVIQLNSAFRIKKMKKGDKKVPFTLYPGIGLRLGDALQFMVGAEYKKYKFSIGYDYSVNDYATYTKSGALEVAVQRVFEIKKKPEIKPIIFCPRI